MKRRGHKAASQPKPAGQAVRRPRGDGRRPAATTQPIANEKIASRCRTSRRPRRDGATSDANVLPSGSVETAGKRYCGTLAMPQTWATNKANEIPRLKARLRRTLASRIVTPLQSIRIGRMSKSRSLASADAPKAGAVQPRGLVTTANNSLSDNSATLENQITPTIPTKRPSRKARLDTGRASSTSAIPARRSRWRMSKQSRQQANASTTARWAPYSARRKRGAKKPAIGRWPDLTPWRYAW